MVITFEDLGVFYFIACVCVTLGLSRGPKGWDWTGFFLGLELMVPIPVGLYIGRFEAVITFFIVLFVASFQALCLLKASLRREAACKAKKEDAERKKSENKEDEQKRTVYVPFPNNDFEDFDF